MVYHAVRRPFWRASKSGIKFAGTTVVLGLAATLAGLGLTGMGQPASDSSLDTLPILALALGLATIIKLAFEARDRRAPDDRSPLGHTARLLRGPLGRQAFLRRLLGVAGGIVLPALTAAATVPHVPGVIASSAILALVLSLGGELLERSLFFTAVVKPRMPGVFH
jgi:hypothetical protein